MPPDNPKRKPPSRVTKSPGQSIEPIPKVIALSELSVTPLQLLGIILKAVLKDRITAEEIDRISVTYYDAITRWFN